MRRSDRFRRDGTPRLPTSEFLAMAAAKATAVELTRGEVKSLDLEFVDLPVCK